MTLQTTTVPITAVIERLEQTDLQPSPLVNELFAQLVDFALQKELNLSGVDLPKVHDLCARGESNLEAFWAQQIRLATEPRNALTSFPYWRNYQELSQAEVSCIAQQLQHPARILFIGCGPLPLSAILFAKSSAFSSVEAIDSDLRAVGDAKEVCALLESSVIVRHAAAETFDFSGFDVVFMAALVGMTNSDKQAILQTIRETARPGALVAARSVTAQRELLYPKLESTPKGFREVARYIPQGEVINSLHVFKIEE